MGNFTPSRLRALPARCARRKHLTESAFPALPAQMTESNDREDKRQQDCKRQIPEPGIRRDAPARNRHQCIQTLCARPRPAFKPSPEINHRRAAVIDDLQKGRGEFPCPHCRNLRELRSRPITEPPQICRDDNKLRHFALLPESPQ